MPGLPLDAPLALLAALPGKGYLQAALMLGVLIFLHELGHFLVARWMGMPVETFSLGFGWRLVGFKWRETDVRLSALPLGGYVKLAGFNPEDPGAEDPHGFLQQPAWKRILFYSGGVLANLATAFVLLTAVGTYFAKTKLTVLRVGQVVASSPAEAAGIRPGDELVGVDALPLPATEWTEVVSYIQKHPGVALSIRLRREGQPLTLVAVPRAEGGLGRLGLAPQQPREEDVAWEQRPYRISDLGAGARFSVQRIWDMTRQVAGFLGQLVTFRASSAQVAGPIGIVRQTALAAQAGWDVFIGTMAALSLQLAILNILPIPMLDGGHVLVLVLERLRRRDFTLEFKEKLFTGGFLLLASLMALVIFLDVMKLRR